MTSYQIEPWEIALRDFLALKQLALNAKWPQARDLWIKLRADLNAEMGADFDD